MDGLGRDSASLFTPLPLACKVLLVEQRSVGAQERVLDGVAFRKERADVEHLTAGLDVSVVTWPISISLVFKACAMK